MRVSDKKTVFLVAWEPESARALDARLREAGFEVQSESRDGQEAYKRVKAAAPFAVVIDLGKMPSHGFAVAESIRQAKATREIPLYLLSTTDETAKKAAARIPGAKIVRPEAVATYLSGARDRAEK